MIRQGQVRPLLDGSAADRSILSPRSAAAHRTVAPMLALQFATEPPTRLWAQRCELPTLCHLASVRGADACPRGE